MKLTNIITIIISLALAAGMTVEAQRVAILSDIHVSPGKATEGQLRNAVVEINSSDADMVFVIGDLTTLGTDRELANVKSILDSIALPLYVVPGNHETTWSESAARTFEKMWGADRFAVETDSLIFVATACGPYMKMGDGHIKTEDLTWLRATLDAPVKAGKRVISLNHYPLDKGLDNFLDYMAVIEDYPVALHINGHIHQWKSYTAGNQKGTLPGVMVRALDMGKGDYGYTIVDFGPEWIHVYNKTIGQPAVPKMAFPMVTGYKRVEVPSREWSVPDGFAVNEIWADDASVFARVAVDGERVYFGNSQGKLRAVDIATGTLAWELPADGAVYSRAALLDKGRVAFPTTVGITLATRQGKLLRELESDATPFVADGLVMDGAWLQGGLRRMELRRASDGKVKWSYDSIFNYCQAQPAVSGNDVVFGAWDTNLRCIDRRNGRLRWVWNNGKPNDFYSPGNVVPAIVGDKVIIVAPDRYMTAIDRATGRTLWRDKSHRYRESMGVSADSTRVYAKTMDGCLVAVDTQSPGFRELWTVDLGMGYEHAPCVVVEHDGVVYAGSISGMVVAVDAATHSKLWALPLGSSEVNGFEIGPDGAVYASLVEGKIYRIAKL